MRKIYSILAVAGTVLFTSCDNFLDITPVGKVVPKSYDDFRMLLTKAYHNVPVDRSRATLRSDELLLDPDSYSYNNYKDIYYWNDAQQDPNTYQFPYQEDYKTIFLANQVIIDGKNATDGTVDEVNQLVGEAYLLRAYMHFNLVNLYANQYGDADPTTQRGVPISTKTDLENPYYPNTVAEVYSQIVSDIKAALPLLNVSEQPKGINYRFSKVSAYGFAARVYLYMKDYKTAAEYAKQALDINSKLQDLNVASSLSPVSYKSDENILALEQTLELNLANETSASQSLISSYDQANDLRFSTYFTMNKGVYKINLGGTPEFRVSMRTSELYLMMAEALAQTDGKLADGKEYLKQLLSKRLKPAAYTTATAEVDAMDKATFTAKVFDERKRELACQGFRWFDLRRSGKPAISKNLDGKTVTLNQNDPRYTIPFPKDAIANNPYLTK